MKIFFLNSNFFKLEIRFVLENQMFTQNKTAQKFRIPEIVEKSILFSSYKFPENWKFLNQNKKKTKSTHSTLTFLTNLYAKILHSIFPHLYILVSFRSPRARFDSPTSLSFSEHHESRFEPTFDSPKQQ